MLNHTYTSVKNANLVDCGKKQHIPSQQFPLLRDNFLGEFRTELDKKKVLANLGIATELSLVWENIQGDIGKSQALMKELDSRTKYTSILDPKISTVIEGLQYIETIIGGEEDAETVQNERLEALETSSKELLTSLQTLDTYIKETVDVDIDALEKDLSDLKTHATSYVETLADEYSSYVTPFIIAACYGLEIQSENLMEKKLLVYMFLIYQKKLVLLLKTLESYKKMLKLLMNLQKILLLKKNLVVVILIL